MMDKIVVEKLGLFFDEECVFLNVEKLMFVVSQNLLVEGKLKFRYDLCIVINSEI